MAPVGYQRINKETNEIVPWEETVNGYKYKDDEYIMLSDEDFRRADVDAAQTIKIIDFVDAAEIHVIHYDKPYYLAPIKKSEKGYALLRETLRRANKVGIAKIVIRTREHLAVLVPCGLMLLLELLRFNDELRSIDTFDLPGENLLAIGVSGKEIDMAQRLVEGMLEQWQPDKYHDEYRERLLAFIDKKIAAGQAKTIAEQALEDWEEKHGEIIDVVMDPLKLGVEKARNAREPRLQKTLRQFAMPRRKTPTKSSRKTAPPAAPKSSAQKARLRQKSKPRKKRAERKSA
jgi:Ku protein, prokaryotic